MMDVEEEKKAYFDARDAMTKLRQSGWFEQGLFALAHRICDECPRGNGKD